MKKIEIKILNTIKGKTIRGGQFIDAYNQQLQQDVSCTLLADVSCFHGNGFVIVEDNVSGKESDKINSND